MSADNRAHLRMIALVQGAAQALVAQIEDELPALPWSDELRKVVAQDLESGFGPVVAGTLERLVLAAATPGLQFPGEGDER